MFLGVPHHSTGPLSHFPCARKTTSTPHTNTTRRNGRIIERKYQAHRLDIMMYLSFNIILGWPNITASIHPSLLTYYWSQRCFISAGFNDDHSWERGSADNTPTGLAPADRCGSKSVRKETRSTWYCVFLEYVIIIVGREGETGRIQYHKAKKA